ncbi:MAG TPA: PQQ-binding-like beta-propeller repeat protein [Pirellulales bacterium]|nr:PQQ-binding-like beta-propeller repeat protein [Pirellulales bacterium]
MNDLRLTPWVLTGEPTRRLLILVTSVAVMSLGMVPIVFAQFPGVQGMRPVVWPPPTSGNPNAAIGQAKVNVDSDQNENIARADRYLKNGRYDLAAIVWQRILDDAQDVLTTHESWSYETVDKQRFGRYVPLVSDIERTIAVLPPEGLAAYRRHVDPQVTALMNRENAKDREAGLNEIVRRFFLSSSGDDAAFELASRALDRYDFIAAFQLLSRLKDRYPDSNLPARDVGVRLAVAAAHIGERQMAGKLMDGWDQERGSSSKRATTLVRKEIQRLALELPRGNWASSIQPTILLGTEHRHGSMPDVARIDTDDTLKDAWYDDFFPVPIPDSKKQAVKPKDNVQILQRRGGVVIRTDVVRNPMLQQRSKQELIQRWKQVQWRPTAQLLTRDGRVFLASHDRLMCRDIETGKLQWMSQAVAYRPVFPYSQFFHFAQQQRAGLNTAPTVREMQLFIDRLSRSMTICGDHLVAIQPRAASSILGRQHQRPNPIAGPEAYRNNRLVAYELATGKLAWTIEAKGENGPGYFAAAPIPAGENLLTVEIRDGAIWLVALDPATGERGIETLLCFQPDGGRSIWLPVGMAVEGNVAYVATGAGVVVAVDARWGKIQWVAQYPRGSLVNRSTAILGPNVVPLRNRLIPHAQQMPHQRKVLDGCSEDVVIPRGPQIVVLASDCSSIFAIDRHTGQLRWSTPSVPHSRGDAVDYCLGVLDDYLYLAGPEVVRCYEIRGGRATWSYEGLRSTGRAALTRNAIYVPQDDSIACLDPRPQPMSNADRRQRTLEFSEANMEPIGNLISDGKHLLGIGMGRVHKIGTDSESMARSD